MWVIMMTCVEIFSFRFILFFIGYYAFSFTFIDTFLCLVRLGHKSFVLCLSGGYFGLFLVFYVIRGRVYVLGSTFGF